MNEFVEIIRASSGSRVGINIALNGCKGCDRQETNSNGNLGEHGYYYLIAFVRPMSLEHECRESAPFVQESRRISMEKKLAEENPKATTC